MLKIVTLIVALLAIAAARETEKPELLGYAVVPIYVYSRQHDARLHAYHANLLHDWNADESSSSSSSSSSAYSSSSESSQSYSNEDKELKITSFEEPDVHILPARVADENIKINPLEPINDSQDIRENQIIL